MHHQFGSTFHVWSASPRHRPAFLQFPGVCRGHMPPLLLLICCIDSRTRRILNVAQSPKHCSRGKTVTNPPKAQLEEGVTCYRFKLRSQKSSRNKYTLSLKACMHLKHTFSFYMAYFVKKREFWSHSRGTLAKFIPIPSNYQWYQTPLNQTAVE